MLYYFHYTGVVICEIVWSNKWNRNAAKNSIFVRLVFSVVFGGTVARRRPPRAPRKKKRQYKTAVKRKVTSALCTRGRATVVFSKHVFENAHLNRDHVQKLPSAVRFYSAVRKHYKTAARSSKPRFRGHNFEFQ